LGAGKPKGLNSISKIGVGFGLLRFTPPSTIFQ